MSDDLYTLKDLRNVVRTEVRAGRPYFPTRVIGAALGVTLAIGGLGIGEYKTGILRDYFRPDVTIDAGETERYALGAQRAADSALAATVRTETEVVKLDERLSGIEGTLAEIQEGLQSGKYGCADACVAPAVAPPIQGVNVHAQRRGYPGLAESRTPTQTVRRVAAPEPAQGGECTPQTRRITNDKIVVYGLDGEVAGGFDILEIDMGKPGNYSQRLETQLESIYGRIPGIKQYAISFAPGQEGQKINAPQRGLESAMAERIDSSGKDCEAQTIYVSVFGEPVAEQRPDTQRVTYTLPEDVGIGEESCAQDGIERYYMSEAYAIQGLEDTIKFCNPVRGPRIEGKGSPNGGPAGGGAFGGGESQGSGGAGVSDGE